MRCSAPTAPLARRRVCSFQLVAGCACVTPVDRRRREDEQCDCQVRGAQEEGGHAPTKGVPVSRLSSFIAARCGEMWGGGRAMCSSIWYLVRTSAAPQQAHSTSSRKPVEETGLKFIQSLLLWRHRSAVWWNSVHAAQTITITCSGTRDRFPTPQLPTTDCRLWYIAVLTQTSKQ